MRGRKWIVLLALCGGVWILCRFLPLPASLYLKAEPAAFSVCEFLDPGYRQQTLTPDETDALTALLADTRVQWCGRTEAFDDTPVFYLYQTDAGGARTGHIVSLSYSKAGDLYLGGTRLHPVGEAGRKLYEFLSRY